MEPVKNMKREKEEDAGERREERGLGTDVSLATVLEGMNLVTIFEATSLVTVLER